MTTFHFNSNVFQRKKEKFKNKNIIKQELLNNHIYNLNNFSLLEFSFSTSKFHIVKQKESFNIKLKFK